jgi:hypothetical protein
VSNQISTSINTTSGIDADGNAIRTVSTFAQNNPNLARFATGFVSGVTGAYIRHGITNNEINFRDVAADSVGNTLADEIVGGLMAQSQTSKSIAKTDSYVDPIRGEHMRMATRNDASSDDRIRLGIANMSGWGANNSDIQQLTPDDLDAIAYSETADAGDPMLVAGAGKLRGLRDGDRSYFGGLRLTQENVDAFGVNPSRVINADSFSGAELLGQSKESSQTFAGIGLSLLNSALEFGKMGLDFVNLANPQTYFDRAQGRSTTYSSLGNALENGASAGDIAGSVWNGIKTLPDRIAQAAEKGNYVDFGREIGDGLQLAYGGAGTVTGTVALTRAGLSLAAKGANALRTGGVGFKLGVNESAFTGARQSLLSPEAEQTYATIRSSRMEDIASISENTGLSFAESTTLKKHIFFGRHALPGDGGMGIKLSRFAADDEIAFAWQAAQKGTTTPEGRAWFRQLADHELGERNLMAKGIPYRNPDAWDARLKAFRSSPPGAHDLAPQQPKYGTFPGFW